MSFVYPDRTDSAGKLLDFVINDYMIYQLCIGNWGSVHFVVCIDVLCV
jgi:hypothetical protein